MTPTIWAHALEAVVAGLSGALGVYATQEAVAALRRRGRCPERWTRPREFLIPRGPKPDRHDDSTS
jgi:hypothetical protein